MEYIHAVLDQIHGFAGVIITFFKALIDFNSVAIDAASGADGLATTYELTEASTIKLIDLIKGLLNK